MDDYTILDILTEEEGYMFVDFPLENGKIDYLLINNYGIFCIKTVDHDKFLTGEGEDEFFYDFKDKKHRKPFPNPVLANEKNCSAIVPLVPDCSIYIVNLIVFLRDNCDLINSDNTYNLEELDDICNSFEAVYSDEEVEYIVECLEKQLEK